MSMPVVVSDVGTGTGSKVDADGAILTVTSKTLTKAGVVGLAAINDNGSVSGTPYVKALYASEDRRLAVGMDTPLFDYSFNATAQNTAIWKFTQATTTMACTLGGGYLTLNSGSVLTANAGVGFQTFRHFTVRSNGSLSIYMSGLITAIPLANQVFEAGLFVQSATGAAPTAPLDGVYFRLTNAGLIGVLNYNNVETPTGVLIAAGSVPVSANAQYRIIVSEEAVEFWVDGVFLGEVTVPDGNGQPFLSGSLPVCMQSRNTGLVVGTPMRIQMSDVRVEWNDCAYNSPLSHQQALLGLMGSQGQDGNTMGTTALMSNNLAAGAGIVMTNTTAALGTGLGGQFGALPSLAAGTDGIVCSYAVPVGSVNITPRTLVITGVRVQAIVTTTLTGGPLAYVYTLAYGHTNVNVGGTSEGTSLTTSPTTKAARRTVIGCEGIAAAAAAGVVGSQNGAYMQFVSPIVVNPGEFVAVLAKNLGTVTTLGVVNFLVSFDSYWI